MSWLLITDDGSVASSVHSERSGLSAGHNSSAGSSSSTLSDSTSKSSTTGASSIISGAIKLMTSPEERDNEKLKRQRKVYEARIASLQSQLSAIQQIVPELMSKSRSRMQKLESAIETQRAEYEEREEKLNGDIEALKRQNERLRAFIVGDKKGCRSEISDWHFVTASG